MIKRDRLLFYYPFLDKQRSQISFLYFVIHNTSSWSTGALTATRTIHSSISSSVKPVPFVISRLPIAGSMLPSLRLCAVHRRFQEQIHFSLFSGQFVRFIFITIKDISIWQISPTYSLPQLARQFDLVCKCKVCKPVLCVQKSSDASRTVWPPFQTLICRTCF